MTINDAMKALAEALEPNPDAPGGSFEYLNESPLGWWRRSVNEDCVARRTSYGQWQPVDPRRSEDASARLLDAMPGWYFNKTVDGYELLVGGSERWRFEHADRKTAIFLAALAWKQLPRPEGL